MLHENICTSLRSDRVTWRQRGKDRLREAAARDKIQCCFSNAEWWNIVYALLEYDAKELSHAKKRGKGFKQDNAIFFRALLKQGLQSALLSEKKAARVIKYVLTVVHDEEVEDESYLREYLDCLCDLLESQKINRYLQNPTIISAVFNCFRKFFSSSSPSLLLVRLLKALCRTIYLDYAVESGILIELLEWMASTLLSAKDIMSSSSSQFQTIVITFCACYSSMMELHGSNCLHELCLYIEPLMDAVIRLFPQVTVTNRDGILQFLVQFYELSLGTLRCEMNLNFPTSSDRSSDYSLADLTYFSIPDRNPLSFHSKPVENASTPILVSLYDIMFDADSNNFMQSLMHYNRAGSSSGIKGGLSANGRDRLTFTNSLDDARFALNIRAVMLTMCLLEGQEHVSAALAHVSIPPSADQLPQPSRSSAQSQSTDFNKNKKYPITALYLSILNLATEVWGDGRLHTANRAQSQLMSQLMTQSGEIMSPRRKSKQSIHTLLESKLYLVISLCQNDMNKGDFLSYLDANVPVPSEDMPSILQPENLQQLKLINLGKWVQLFRYVLKIHFDATQLSGNVSNVHNFNDSGAQLTGILLYTLHTLLLLSRALLQTSNMPSSNVAEDSIRCLWTDVLLWMVTSSMSSTAPSLTKVIFTNCRRQSVAAMLMQLYVTALTFSHIEGECDTEVMSHKNSIVPLSTWYILQQRILQALSPICLQYDPRLMDCPELFKLLSVLSIDSHGLRKSPISPQDAASIGNVSVICKSYISHLQVSSPAGMFATLHRQHQDDHPISMTFSVENDFSEREELLLLFAWLDYFLNTQSLTNGSSSDVGSLRIYVLKNMDVYISSFNALLNAIFSQSCRHDIYGNDDSIPESVVGSGKIKIWDRGLQNRLRNYRDLNVVVHQSMNNISPPHCLEDNTTLPSSEFSAKTNSVYIACATVALKHCELLFSELTTDDVTASEIDNEFLSQWQIVMLFLSTILVSVMRHFPQRSCLQIAYSSRKDREDHKACLGRLKNIIINTIERFWSTQEAIFQMLATKLYLFRGNGSSSNFGCVSYHSMCMETCSAALTEIRRIGLILEDMTAAGITGSKQQQDKPLQALSTKSCTSRVLKYLQKIVGDSTMFASMEKAPPPSPPCNSRTSHHKTGELKLHAPVDDDDDDFMEKVNSTSTSQSFDRSRSFQDESEMETASSSRGEIRVSFGKDQLQMICATISCFLAASMSHLCNSEEDESRMSPLSKSCSEAIGKVVDSLTILHQPQRSSDNFQGFVGMKLPSEVALTVAEQMSTLAYPSSAIHSFLVSNTWCDDWGVLGYYRVLEVIRRLTNHPDYFNLYQRSSCSLVRKEYTQIFRIVFCTCSTSEVDSESESETSDDGDDKKSGNVGREIWPRLQQYLQEYWGNRVLQLECGANIFNASPQIHKRDFGDILLQGLIDNDKRVRQACVAYLPLLFWRLPNHSKIFKSIKTFMRFDDTIHEVIYNCSDCVLPPSELSKLDDIQKRAHSRKMKKYELLQDDIAIKMCAIAMCGLASGNILAESIRDLLLLYVATNTNFGADEHSGDCAQSFIELKKYAKSNSEHFEQLSIRQKSYEHVRSSGIVEALLFAVAYCHGYLSPYYLFRDNLYFLLHQWLSVLPLRLEIEIDEGNCADDGDAVEYQDTNFCVPLAAFPFKWLCYETFQAFLQAEAEVILPLICKLQPSQHRWAQLRCYTNLLGLANNVSEDQAIALVIRKNIAHIRGAQLALSSGVSFLGTHTVYNDQCNSNEQIRDDKSSRSLDDSDGSDEGEYISQLLSRVMNEEELRRYLLLHGGPLSQVVESILCHGYSWTNGCNTLSGFWDVLMKEKQDENVNSEASADGCVEVFACYAQFDRDMSALLSKVAEYLEKRSKTELFLETDILSVFARLKMLLHATKSEYKKTYYSFAINYLSKYVSSKIFLENAISRSAASSSTIGANKRYQNVELTTRAMLSALVATQNEAPVLLDLSVYSLKRMVESVVLLLSSPISTQKHSKLIAALVPCLADIHAEVVSLICAVNIGLVRAFLAATRTLPGSVVSPSEAHGDAVLARKVLSERSCAFVMSKFSNVIEFTEQHAQDWTAFRPEFAEKSLYCGHNRSCPVSSYTSKRLRGVMDTVMSCQESQQLSPALIFALPTATMRLLFMDWDCLRYFYKDMEVGDVESCKLTEEMQMRLEVNSSHASLTEYSMRSLNRSAWQFVQGNMVSTSLLWLKLRNLREILQPISLTHGSSAYKQKCETNFNGIKSSQDDETESVTCMESLLELGNVFTSTARYQNSCCELDSLQREAAYIVGSLGFQDLNSVSHRGLTLATQIQGVDRGIMLGEQLSHSSINGQLACNPTYLKVDLISKLLSLTFQPHSFMAEEAMIALQRLQGSSALFSLQNEISETCSASNSHKGYNLRTLSASSESLRFSLAVLDCFGASQLTQDDGQGKQKRDIIFCGEGHARTGSARNASQHCESMWDESVWSTAGKSYCFWITMLVSTLIRICYFPNSTQNSRKERTACENMKEGLFMRSLYRLASKNAAVAESIFPLVLLDMIESNKLTTTSKRSDPSQTFSDTCCSLAEMMKIHLLGADGGTPSLRATQLGCKTLVFLLRRQICSFRSTHSRLSDMSAVKSSKKRPLHSPDSLHCADDKCPYSIGIPLDFVIVAEAASSCGSICTASLFIELAAERFYWERDMNESEVPVISSDATNHSDDDHKNKFRMLISDSGDISRDIVELARKNFSIYERNRLTYDSSRFSHLPMTLLRELFYELHDPDASIGIPASTNHSVSAQAGQYAQTGQWQAALGTYQCMLQLPEHSGDDGDGKGFHALARMGVAKSLRALGYRPLLDQHLLQVRRGDNVPLSQRIKSDDISALVGEGSWRQLLLAADNMNVNCATIADGGQSAIEVLSTWPIQFESQTPDSSIRSEKCSEDYFSSALCASMKYIRAGDGDTALTRLSLCAELLYPTLLENGQREGRKSMMAHLLRLQQLVEFQEIATCYCNSVSGSNHSIDGTLHVLQGKVLSSNNDNIEKVLNCWRKRLINGSALNASVSCETLLALRLSLLVSLPTTRVNSRSSSSNPSDFAEKSRLMLQFMNQIMDVCGTSNNDLCMSSAFLVSPILYQTKAHVLKNLAMSHIDHNEHALAVAELSLFESRLLWKKQLFEAAVASLHEHVINPLAALFGSDPSGHVVTGTEQDDVMIRIGNMLSEAYRTTGKWMADKRSHSGLTVLRRYLEPAVALALHSDQRVKTHLTLAQYHLYMHQTVAARVSSQEWKQGQQLALERRQEYERSKDALKRLQQAYQLLAGPAPGSSASSSSRGGRVRAAPPMTDEQSALYQKLVQANRHVNVLKRESTIDEKEREEVEKSVQLHLIEALDHYRTVLVLAQPSTVSVDTVFHTIHLWFKSSHVPEVNSIIRDIIYRAPSFHFVPLHYQIMSRLDGSANESLCDLKGESSLRRAAPAFFGSSQTGTPLSGNQVHFQNSLAGMLFKLGKDHPYHILPQLFALLHEKLNWENITAYDTAVSGFDDGEGRMKAARAILHALKNHFYEEAKNSCSSNEASLAVSPLAYLVQGMEILFVQYVKLALTNMEKFIQAKRTKNIRFSELVGRGETPFHECLNGLEMPCIRPAEGSSVPITKKRSSSGLVRVKDISSLTTCSTPDFYIPVITKSHKVLSDANYHPSHFFASKIGCESSGVCFVHGFSPEFSLTDDGLSRPKIIKCLGSDGQSYTQLVKGGDDTRQDSVMEQVFDHVNTMLRNDQACMQRHLNIRTYKIVPTTPQSGIIEWVENTIPFGSYLCERPRDTCLGAHSRYHPNDLKSGECRALMSEAKDKSSEEKEHVFLSICRQFRPAFRYFFLETFADPSDWVEARISYTRGVAAVCMIGYILGIGDRHAHNILVDTTTAEVVHIDFGIMFEQGKVIGTPETVPFRLTRDVVDGMGVTGVEGSFRKCCEEVLRVLRENMSQLLTILEVVIHDPLYKWSLSPVQAEARRRKQLHGVGTFMTQSHAEGPGTVGGGVSSASQDAAQRALLRIQNKLQGYEDPSGQSMSTAGQVQYVINEARDPKNLCKLFPGWTPWV